MAALGIRHRAPVGVAPMGNVGMVWPRADAILLPIAAIGTVLLLALGAVQNFSSGTDVTTLVGERHPHFVT